MVLIDLTGMEDSLKVGSNKEVLESTGLCILYMITAIVAALLNGSVIISAILERWKEVDNFTFVFSVSLSFNHFFLAFHIHSMMTYSAVADTWGLHSIPCLGMGMLSFYLHNLYLLQILLIIFDSTVARFVNWTEFVSVSLCKKIALHSWVIALIPQVSPILLKFEDPFLYSAAWGGCFQDFIFRDVSTLFKCIGIYLVLPIAILIIWYLVMIYKGEGSRRLAITVSRMNAEEGGIVLGRRRQRTTEALIVMYIISTFPYVVCNVVRMAKDTEISKHALQFASLLYCLGSIFVPIIYVLFCPTFCRFVIPEKRYPGLYKLLKWTHPPPHTISKFNGISINRPQLNKIEEVAESDDDDDYIELPAVNITLNTEETYNINNLSPPCPRY